ncbi:MAG: class I SAM-dependent methyltransferase, partial [Chloroflexi bacterium]|nr:class I SAM-dependent methyltransferase [Chloroflexota bacterium]
RLASRGARLRRTPYVDDRVARAIAHGLPQLAILGAGFDTRACGLAARTPPAYAEKR